MKNYPVRKELRRVSCYQGDGQMAKIFDRGM